MARIKYAPGIVPLSKEQSGFVFSPSHYCDCMKIAAKSDKARQRNQINRKLNLMQAVTNWRNLTAAQQLAWKTFATTYPQPTKRNPAIFLTGYQLFIKRQQYVFLNESIESDWLIPPLTAPIPALSYSVSVDQVDNCLDVSEPYLNAFGILPQAGDYLILKVIAMATATGQYFPPVTDIVQVNAVYIDGLFVSLSFTGQIPDCVFSIFLSQPVHQSVQVNQYKTRYMGCFTSKKFIQLTDCPGSYAGQAGKIPTVNALETGLEFKTPASGGLTCETLAACAKIIAMDAYSLNLLMMMIQSGICSSKVIRYGAMYNFKTVTDAKGFAPLGTHIPTQAEWTAIQTAAGGASVAASYLKEQGTTFWSTFLAAVTNSLKANWRGSGVRSASGNFSDLLATGWIWSSTSYNSVYAYFAYCDTATASFQINVGNKIAGYPIRLIRDDGSLTPIVGNDGTIYRMTKIGSYSIMADNSIETKFRDGSLIPYVTDNATWAANAGPMACFYNNLQSNAYV